MSKIIKLIDNVPEVTDDNWEVLRATDELAHDNFAGKIVPLPFFRDMPAGEHDVSAVWISPEDDFESLVGKLLQLKIIAVDFPSFRDGRGYSIATLLRTRYKWRGELRAIGDVLRDQLNYMRRCGFDAFAVRADKDIGDAVKSFTHYSIRYQGSVDEPLPLFRRRPEQLAK